MNTKYKILIVDDVELNRALLNKIFANAYSLYEAVNGKEAMEVLRNNEINLVLLDLSMPQMDGYEVIRSMKIEQRLASIPIVVTTGAIDKSERKALDLGADDFVTKPYDPYIVRKRVDNLIQKYVLQVDNLRQSLSQAEQLNRAKSSFLSRMSHDLRSPLNSVISLSHIIVDNRNNPDKVVELCEKIDESSHYLLGVINDILDVSAIESQKITITKSPFDFRRQIEAIVAMFYGQCKEKNVEFKLSLSGVTEEYLFGDPLRLKEVLVNLVSNAIKFTPSGGHVMVKVHQLSRLDDMVKLRFEVIDDGEGIEENRLKNIFEPFTQENEQTMQRHGGSGLGLSIVKSITSLMGGTVGVTSEKGVGSTFSVDLPFNIAKELPQISSEKLKKVRALIIDDDVETQEYGKKVMDKLGVTCDIASSGKEALAMMHKAYNESRGYDICFIDWRMPGMTGIEVTKAIREAFDDDTVIVVASAYDVAEIDKEAKMNGANVVVAKPMFQSTVFDLLMNMTGGKYLEAQKSVKYSFKGKKALLAEDNTLNAEILTALLQVVGMDVERAVDGKDAFEKFTQAKEQEYDIIFMDIQMPILNGYEATAKIRESGKGDAKTIPIVAVTANAFIEDIKRSLAAGMNDHMAKPIESERLYQVLEKFIATNKTVE